MQVNVLRLVSLLVQGMSMTYRRPIYIWSSLTASQATTANRHPCLQLHCSCWPQRSNHLHISWRSYPTYLYRLRCRNWRRIMIKKLLMNLSLSTRSAMSTKTILQISPNSAIPPVRSRNKLFAGAPSFFCRMTRRYCRISRWSGQGRTIRSEVFHRNRMP